MTVIRLEPSRYLAYQFDGTADSADDISRLLKKIHGMKFEVFIEGYYAKFWNPHYGTVNMVRSQWLVTGESTGFYQYYSDQEFRKIYKQTDQTCLDIPYHDLF